MGEVNATIITIGDELLIGQTIDTNSAFIGKELNKIGIWVKKRIAVGDVKEDIIATLKAEAEQVQVIIITGGLGPTADDITKPVLCEYFGGRMIIDDGALQNVKSIFERYNRPVGERNLKQAEVPEACTVLPNLRGTAPGMWFEKDGVVYASLPGVPDEMRGLMLDSVIPKLKQAFSLPVVLHRTLLTAGVGESVIADTISEFEAALPAHIKLAYLPAFGLVRMRLTARGETAGTIEKEIGQQFEKLKKEVEQWMIAAEDIPLQEVVNRTLREKGKTVSTVESCTGGYIAHLITSRPGSSSVFKGSVVAYSNEVKTSLVGVKPGTIEKSGAVSEETVREMGTGLLKKMDTDYVIATSGIMGPDGGSAEKLVGTVWIAVGNKEKITATKHHFRFDRTKNIELTAHTALTRLIRFIREQETE